MKAKLKKRATATASKQSTARKKRVVRKSAKAVTKKAAYLAYVRDHEKAYRTLADIDSSTIKSMQSTVKRVLSKQGI